MEHDLTWVTSPSERKRLVDAYVTFVTTRAPAGQWASEAIHDAIWHYVDPEIMLDLVVEIIDRVADDKLALSIVAAGPLENLLGGKDTVMRRAEEEARTNSAFRQALATVYGVRYNEEGYAELHRLTRTERSRLP